MQQLVSKMYTQVSQRTASDNLNELAVFQQITGELQAVAAVEKPSPAAWGDAISRNMQLWTILVTDLMQPENLLPEDTKQGLLKLGIFVLSHSKSVLESDDDLDVLIDINRNIIDGLKQQPKLEVV